MALNSLVKVFILDDDLNAIELLRKILTDLFAVEIVGTATNGTAAIKEVVEIEPDLIFLDIELPDMTGLDFFREVGRQVKPETKVVFYTGYDQYMLDAIRSEAFDYLLKPATVAEVSSIMARYYENKLKSLPTARPGDNGDLPQILVVNTRNEHRTLRMEEIAFFRYGNQNRQWEAVCIDKRCYKLRHRTTADAILNYSRKFIQTHKRYIVNSDYVSVIQETNCLLKEPMEEVTEVKISKNYKQNLMGSFYNM